MLAADRVWLVEGEKDVDNARKLGLTATTWPFGVDHWDSRYLPALKGKNVIINLDRGFRTQEEKAARDIVEVALRLRPRRDARHRDGADRLGIGKTYMLADIAARVSRGDALPVYRKPTDRVAHGWVVFITSEGVPRQILKPRPYATNANMNNITLIKGRVTKTGDFTLLDIRFHLDDLLSLLKNDPRPCALVIIDPLASFVSGNANLNDMTQTRQALDAVVRFAEAAAVAVVVAIHPNKNETQQLQNRAAGSVQMSAAVKTCWVVVEPGEDDPVNMRFLAPYKIAMAPCDKRETLPFYLENADFVINGKGFEMARIRWAESVTKRDIEAIISPRANEGINLSAKARALLKEQFKDGQPRRGRDLLALGEESGIKSATMYKVKEQLGIDDAPGGKGSPWMWIPPAEWPR